MTYRYTDFDGVALPLFNARQEHDAMRADSTILDSIGTAFDWRGTSRRRGRKQMLTVSGIYIGETSYLVYDANDSAIDSSGDNLIAASALADVRMQVTALLQKKGAIGELWRERVDDGEREWKTARLLEVGWARNGDDPSVVARVSCKLETVMEYWRAEEITTVTATTVSGVAEVFYVENSGELLENATITVTRTSGTITAVSITRVDFGISLVWSGSLGASDVLVINCEQQTVQKNGVDAYSGLSLSSHTAEGWFPVPTGSHNFAVTTTGGAATVTVEHYNQFP